MKARKKPVIVDFFRYDGDFVNTNGEYYIPDWAVYAYGKGILTFTETHEIGPGDLHIKTLEGWMRPDVGDYIIKGIEGEIYSCKPDIFEKTYEIIKE